MRFHKITYQTSISHNITPRVFLSISGGEHYQGMADLVQKQRSTVDISKMTGRNDDNDPYDEEQGILGQILELSILDPKPNGPRSKGFVFSDPDKVPRFENLSLEGTVLHSCAVIYLIIMSNFTPIIWLGGVRCSPTSDLTRC